jgi:GPN-loop GTPase
MVDAHLCTDASKYISALMLSLKTMIQLELPHINVLSKIDLIQSYGKLSNIIHSFFIQYVNPKNG